jgi:hypothetical protein
MEQEPEEPRSDGFLFKLAAIAVFVLAFLSPFVVFFIIAAIVLRLMRSSTGDYF